MAGQVEHMHHAFPYRLALEFLADGYELGHYRQPIVSSARGGSPPLRRMIRSKAAKSARAWRSAKNSPVVIAASFSATAVAMNWFTLMPSCFARFSTSALTERGRRSGYVL